MKRLTTAAILAAGLALLSGAHPTQAPAQEAAATPDGDQAETKIDGMSVDIWPEYDDPRVLVIYRGTLAPGLTTPRDFSFLVPTGAEIHMAGAVDETRGHVHALFETKDRGDGLTEVSYSLPNPNFYMEFYYDPLGDTPERDFTYRLVSPFPIDQLMVSVQEPRRAEGFAMTPATNQIVRDDAEGLSYHVVGFSDVAAGEAQTVSVSYRKGDREPSVVAEDGAGAQGADSRAMRSILIFSAILLVGVVGYGVFVTLQKRDAEADGGLSDAFADPITDVNFCSQCGEEVAPTDRFCGICGHPVQAGIYTHIEPGSRATYSG
jgi:zinc-ribbon domain